MELNGDRGETWTRQRRTGARNKDRGDKRRNHRSVTEEAPQAVVLIESSAAHLHVRPTAQRPGARTDGRDAREAGEFIVSGASEIDSIQRNTKRHDASFGSRRRSAADTARVHTLSRNNVPPEAAREAALLFKT